MLLQKVALIGVGLLGGSLGLAIKQRGLARAVHGFVRRAEAVTECERSGVVDHATTDLSLAVREADFVILCTPIAQMPELATRMLPALKGGVIVTDVGSVKAGLVKALEPLFASAGAHFVGSHPMAGGEKMGASAARADLFENAVCIVTPSANSAPAAIAQVEKFWREVGGRILRLAPETHDQLVSRSSHLPHVVAAALANHVLNPNHGKEQPLVCATGFRDTTRIASGSPEMWRDIALANRANLARTLGGFIDDLKEFQRVIEADDAAAISRLLEIGKLRRDNWLGSGNQSPE
ncbi:MAG: prephenate dehydrogenase [Verrucomicrobia bacterium]|nr:prephenate dehydrogenase [Verrucomicrobiota bacterium]